MELLKRRKAPGWMAVCLEAEGAALIHVVRNDQGPPAVSRCEAVALPAGDGKAFARAARELGLAKYRCTTLLTGQEYQVMQVEAPPVPREELRQAMRWRIKDMVDFPVDSATVDVLEVPVHPSARGARSAFAVAARNDAVRARMGLFEEARLQLDAIDIPEAAQRNIAALYEREGRALALLAFGERGGLLTFTAGGELYAFRRIEVTLGQLNDADESQRQQNLERVVLELQRSLDSFDRQHHYYPVEKLLLAPLPPSAGLQEYLLKNLYVPVETLDLGDVLDLSACPALKDPESQTVAFRAVGAALRVDEAPSTQSR